MERERVPAWVWMVLVMAHTLALAWALHSGRWNFPDSERYQQAARNLMDHGHLYARPWPRDAPNGQAMQEFSIRPPGYPAVLGALGSAGSWPWPVLLLQNGLSLLVLGSVLSWWARRVRPVPKHWFGAVALVLTFPAQLIYASGVMSEASLQGLLLALTIAAAAFGSTGRVRHWAVMAAAVALALLFKPVCCLLAVGMGASGLVLGWRRRAPMMAVVGLLPLLVMVAYMARNQQQTGYFHFSSITEINLLHYNAAGVVRQVEGPAAEAAWVAGVLRVANAETSFAARECLIQQKAEAILMAYPLVYARQHAVGMAAFFLDPGRFDVSEFLGLAPLAGGGLLGQVRAGGWCRAIGQLPWGLLVGLLAVMLANIARLMLAVRGFRRLRRGPRAWRVGRWVAVGLLAYLALLTGPLGAARFLMPAWPLLLGLALVGLHGPAEPPIGRAATGASA